MVIARARTACSRPSQTPSAIHTPTSGRIATAAALVENRPSASHTFAAATSLPRKTTVSTNAFDSYFSARLTPVGVNERVYVDVLNDQGDPDHAYNGSLLWALPEGCEMPRERSLPQLAWSP